MEDPQSQSPDAAEVRAVLASLLRPYRAAILAGLAVVGTGGTQLWHVSDVDGSGHKHELQQDANDLELRKQIVALQAEAKSCRDGRIDIIQMSIDHRALLTANQLELMPKKKRDRARANFEAQRKAALALLVGTRKE